MSVLLVNFKFSTFFPDKIPKCLFVEEAQIVLKFTKENKNGRIARKNVFKKRAISKD